MPGDPVPSDPAAPDPKPWTFDVNFEGGSYPTDYGTGTEWDGSHYWVIYDGPREIDDVVLAGMAAEDPTPVLAALVAEHNRAGGGAPDEVGDDLTVNVTHLTPGQIAGAAEGLDMASRIEPVRIPTPDEPGDDLTELRRLLADASMRNWKTSAGSSWEVHSPGFGQRTDVVASFPYKGDPRAKIDSQLVVAMRNRLPELLDEIERLRAAAGSPAPTPGPTREQIVEAIRSYGLFRRESEAAAHAVMALLSTQPATTVLTFEGTLDSLRAFIRSVEIDIPTLPYEVQGWIEDELEPLRSMLSDQPGATDG